MPTVQHQPLSVRLAKMAFALTSLALIWLVLLPALGDYPQIRRHIDTMQAAGINPSAMYYSELPNLPAAEAEFRRIHRDDPGLLWGR